MLFSPESVKEDEGAESGQGRTGAGRRTRKVPPHSHRAATWEGWGAALGRGGGASLPLPATAGPAVLCTRAGPPTAPPGHLAGHTLGHVWHLPRTLAHASHTQTRSAPPAPAAWPSSARRHRPPQDAATSRDPERGARTRRAGRVANRVLACFFCRRRSTSPHAFNGNRVRLRGTRDAPGCTPAAKRLSTHPGTGAAYCAATAPGAASPRRPPASATDATTRSVHAVCPHGLSTPSVHAVCPRRLQTRHPT